MKQNKKYLTANEIEAIIKRVVARKGYELTEIQSLTTQSRYYKIVCGPNELSFRVSDHPTGSRLMTLRTDRQLTVENVENFAVNRCKDLGKRILKNTLGI